MSETREDYSVTMQPGRELDALVSRAIGGIPARLMSLSNDDVTQNKAFREPPAYSTDPAAALEAWEWLEENEPWSTSEIGSIELCLGRYDGEPSVMVRRGYGLRVVGTIQEVGNEKESNFAIVGQTYPHAISLAVCEAGKLLGVVDI